MNIRMQGDTIAGTGPLRASETTLGAGVEKRKGTASVTSSPDSIGISSLASQIAHANRLAEMQENDRVAALASLYSRGENHVDSLSLSRSLIAHSLLAVSEDQL